MNDQSSQPNKTRVSSATTTTVHTEQPWHASYPAPRSEAKSITRHELLRLLKSDAAMDHDFVLGGTIQGSINLPAQSLWPTISSHYNIWIKAGVRRVIWYCGSSRGRGRRAAGWFADYLNERGESRMQSLVLSEGIKAWAAEKGEFVRYMQEYDESKWS
ncbi:hypothetical protein M409DRAFT_69406 [Zasmidium cellare ATCC 36951]|uniref:Rhodanese domain-containing protein n=1 Tax=Zasmidium cellare ATCC 36951 TaxID=1080233 RepID=A0A6A6C6H5_ZASCE|nr:uncharacterized protein M409DRAFT_69406 [Zasmidium cellare ATCC 36951]KAF2161858.1 hypothetical protein M409DRAFT_69406 [Zasmidium cellare ATCC 36951]